MNQVTPTAPSGSVRARTSPTGNIMRILFRAGLVLGLLLLGTSRLPAQGGSPPRGRAYLFTLDLKGTPLDEFPGAVKALIGVMTVVEKDGQHMLMASSPSEFLITLPDVLPPVFTVEVDLIPKRCCAPDDIMVEGTPTMNRGPASVQLTWHPERISAVGGGGEMYQSNMPDDLAALTPGNLTHLVFEFNGATIKLYTNGRRMYTLDKQFVRGRVLRVWLGGESATNPMYLAGLRVGTGPAVPGNIAGTGSDKGTVGDSASKAQEPTGPTTDGAGFVGFTVTAGSAAGATLTWRTKISGQQLGGFQIERREAGGSFGSITKAYTIVSDFDFTLQDDFSAQAGKRYEYQIKEIDRTGTVIATTAIQGFDVPPPPAPVSDQPPLVTGLAVSSGDPWGARLHWDVDPQVFDYAVEYSDAGGPFQGVLAVGMRGNQLVDQLQPGHHYAFRIKALKSDRSVLGYSATAPFDTPAQWPRVTNLAATVGPLETAQLTFDGTTKPAGKVTWTWDPLPSGWTQMRGTWDRIAIDPATNATTTRRFDQSFQVVPGTTFNIEAGTTVRICLGIVNPLTGKQAENPTCLDTPVAAAPSAIAPVDAVLVTPATTLTTGGTTTPMSLCAPSQTSPGPGPRSVTIQEGQDNPAGANLTWPDVPGAVGYVIDRGTTASGTQTKIASTCADAAAFSSFDTGTGKQFYFRDRTGGIQKAQSYTYVVHAFGNTGWTGWNSVKWTSPTPPYPAVHTPQVTGSTVKVTWDMPGQDPNTYKTIYPPSSYLVTTDFGFTQTVGMVATKSVTINGVPIGDHTVTVTAKWNPDVTTARTVTFKVAP